MAYATGTIAGIYLKETQAVDGVDFKSLILDGGNFRLAHAVAPSTGQDGSTYFQVHGVGSVGVRFGIHMTHCYHSVLSLIVTAVKAALDAGTTFNVTLADGEHSINVSAIPDGINWCKYPRQRTNGVYLSDVVLRFVSMS